MLTSLYGMDDPKIEHTRPIPFVAEVDGGSGSEIAAAKR